MRAKQETEVLVSVDSEKDATVFGADVSNEGVVKVSGDRLYKLVKLGDFGEHILELEFPEGGVEVFAFTFG